MLRVADPKPCSLLSACQWYLFPKKGNSKDLFFMIKANRLFRNLGLWAVDTKAAVCLTDWRMDTLTIVMCHSSKCCSLLSCITSDIAGEVCLSLLLLIHIQALRALYCPVLKNQYCEYCVCWAYLISLVVMATLQGIDSSTGISGLDGPCIEAEIFCPVKSKRILQWTLFHIYLDHQTGLLFFFLLLSLLGELVEGTIYQIFPANSSRFYEWCSCRHDKMHSENHMGKMKETQNTAGFASLNKVNHAHWVYSQWLFLDNFVHVLDLSLWST